MKSECFEIPKKVCIRNESTIVSNIPKIIHQTFKTNVAIAEMKSSIYSWIDLNPDYEYRFYDDEDVRDYVLNFDCSDFNFTKDQLIKCFDSIIPGAGKADLFRYCVLYQDGGVYADIDSVCFKPLNSFIPNDSDILILINTWYKRHVHHIFSQWFLAYTPRNKIIKAVLETCVRCITTRTPVEYFPKRGATLERYTGAPVYNGLLFDFFKLKEDRLNFIPSLRENKKYIVNRYGVYFVFYSDDIHAKENDKNLAKPKLVGFKTEHYNKFLKFHNIKRWLDEEIIFK